MTDHPMPEQPPTPRRGADSSNDDPPRVVRLYRYPVKSLSPEPVEQLDITPDGKVVGDRVYAFRFAHVQPADPQQWLPKTNYASLQHIPELASLTSSYDQASGILTIRHPNGDVLATADPSVPSDRTEISAAISQWYETTESYRQLSHRRQQPHEFLLVGDGAAGRYHDTSDGRITLHGDGSINALAHALDMPPYALHDTRFRSNIVLAGCPPWHEFDWSGKRIQIGDLTLKVIKPVKRCLATHVNPSDGVRDADVLNTLTRVIGMPQPHFAVSTTTIRRRGGTVRLGDELRILD